jgi:hypothetical protein
MLSGIMPKEPLQPLIPLDSLREKLKALLTVSKDEIDKVEAERPKRQRGVKKT